MKKELHNDSGKLQKILLIMLNYLHVSLSSVYFNKCITGRINESANEIMEKCKNGFLFKKQRRV